MLILRDLASLIGIAGFVLGLLSFLRDRPRIKVRINLNETDPENGRPLGVVRVTNVGRRITYITSAGIVTRAGNRRFPCENLQQIAKRQESDEAIIPEIDDGIALVEGSRPAIYIIRPRNLLKQIPSDSLIRGFAIDSAGKAYYSSPWIRWHDELPLWQDELEEQENDKKNR